MPKTQARHFAFVSTTRADWGKLRPLIEVTAELGHCVSVIATGAHFRRELGSTFHQLATECQEHGWVYFPAPIAADPYAARAGAVAHAAAMFALHQPAVDLWVVHGDRVEVLGAAIGASLSGHRVAHIEGGEITGTTDELVRHAVSKLCHLHFVAHEDARRRLMQLGEDEQRIYILGSADLDVAADAEQLPTWAAVAKRYGLEDPLLGVVLLHPVVTETAAQNRDMAVAVGDAVLKSRRRFLWLAPNDDPGREAIDSVATEVVAASQGRVQALPSMRFECFLTLLRHCALLLGNSSAGIRETPFLGVASIDVGTRQGPRLQVALQRGHVMSVEQITLPESSTIQHAINIRWGQRYRRSLQWGSGDSRARWLKAITLPAFWEVPIQKHLVRRDIRLPIGRPNRGHIVGVG